MTLNSCLIYRRRLLDRNKQSKSLFLFYTEIRQKGGGRLENIKLWIFSMIASFCSFISGHIDEATRILLLMMVIDIVTGILKGIKQKRLKSAIMHLGILKKAGILLSIIFASLLDILVNEGMPVFRTLMVWLSIGNEGLSIVENLASLGVYMPVSIKERLANFAQHGKELQSEKDNMDIK
jgi:toxin secretion/phage lysis holin